MGHKKNQFVILKKNVLRFVINYVKFLDCIGQLMWEAHIWNQI